MNPNSHGGIACHPLPRDPTDFTPREERLRNMCRGSFSEVLATTVQFGMNGRLVTGQEK
jgi:hypothetical protein